MNSFRFFSSLAILVTVSVGIAVAQVPGDYGSAGTGNWGTTGANWVICQTAGTWGDAVAATANPTATTNVWIRNGHTVTLEASGKTCLNLTVESGGSLVGDLNLPNSNIRYVRVSGTTATINGIFGATSAPGTVAALEAATTGGTLIITGSGTFGPSRVRVNSGASGATIVFDINTTFWYTGSSGTGGVGLYPQTDNNTFTINAGRTLTFVGNSGLSVASGNGTSASTSLTINVSGMIDLSPDNSPLTLKVGSGKTATMHIYPTGAVTVGGNVSASTPGDGGTTVITDDGSLTVGGNVDFSNPSFVVTGSGTFTVPSAATLIIGHADGISSSGSTGQIQTTTRTFNPAAGYSYAGTSAQVTGTGLPSTVGKLTVNNAAGVSLTGSVTVSDSLIFSSGNIATGANILTVVETGGVSRTSGHIIGTLRKGVPAGAGITRSFEIGTGAVYAPVTVNFANVNTAGNLSATTVGGDHPNLATSTIDPSKSVNRYWSFTNGGVVFSTFDATFNFAASDIDNGAHPGVFISEKYESGSWSGLTEGTRTSTSTQITGATSFSDFSVGEQVGASPTPAFELSSSSMDFGSVTIGHTAADTAYVRNIGTGTLNVSSILSNNTPIFTVLPASAIVAAGDSARIVVSFVPSSPGSASATITFTHDASGSPYTLPASGTGITATAILSNGTGGGEWASAGTWQGGVVPTRVDSAVILGSDSVYVLADTTCSGILVQAGGKLALYDTTTVRNANVNGSVFVQPNGRLAIQTGGNGSFGTGSLYQHGRDGGTFPLATWATGSTCAITGIVSAAPANGNQNFGNIVWNCPSQTGTVNLGWNRISIGGSITIPTTGTGRWQMCAPLVDSTATVTINGDVSFASGNFTTNGTSNGNTTIVIHHNGNINVTGGNFGISRGGQGGTGTTRWYLHNGNYTMSNATAQNSNPAGARFVFAKPGTQTLTLTAVTFAGNGMPFEVASGTTLSAGTSVVGGSGLVMIDSGATLMCGLAGGLDAMLTTTGTKTLNIASSYAFNGAVVQVTGRLLPDTLYNLTINNGNGVACSDSFLVTGTLSLANGQLDLNGKAIILGPSGLLTETAGNTVFGTSGVITTTRTLNAPSSSTNIAGFGVGIGSAANLGSTIVTRGHAVQGGAGLSGIKRYYDITPATNTGLNATLVFRYDDSELNSIPEVNLLLFKSTNAGASWSSAGGTVNTTDNTLTLTGVNDLSRWTAGVSGPITTTRSIPIGQNWNMVSLPLSNPIPDDSVQHLFTNSVNRYAFIYAGGYQQRFTMTNGPGYWIKSSVAYTQDITGTPRDSLTIPVTNAWNMIGSISTAVDTSVAHVTPSVPGLRVSNFFKYAGGYQIVTSIQPGLGYWIKTSGPGSFFMHATGPAAKVSGAVSTRSIEDLHSLTIRDANGGSQTLYFGADGKKEIPVNMFVMPPQPPVGSFDARFETAEGGTMAQTHPEEVSDVIDLPIAIQSSAYPLTVSWKINGTSGSYELSDGAGGLHPVRGEGSLKIASSAVNHITLKVTSGSDVPKEFSLSRNYPNPFNPTTTIKYGLPVDSRVTVEIYNVLGQRVRTLINDDKPAGYHSAVWEGTGNGGQQMASGVYFLHLSAKGVNGKTFTEVRKLMMLK